jgi:hypothetical protein
MCPRLACRRTAMHGSRNCANHQQEVARENKRRFAQYMGQRSASRVGRACVPRAQTGKRQRSIVELDLQSVNLFPFGL